VKRVKGGSDIVQKTNEEFNEVAVAAGKVGELVSEIAAASNEQSQGIEQVNKAMAEMDKITQRNAANAEESASASEQMNAQSEALNSMIGEFTLNGGDRGRKQAKAAAVKHRQVATTALKKIAPVQKAANGARPEKTIAPEAVIPLEDDKKKKKTEDGDFKDF
ncbi:MAG: methyl-accepting chemotaxis protein, partial [Desulfobacterales bacterium]|nr:methyl-accepting chemotaxis protein [Desulfobacterales bacterium]